MGQVSRQRGRRFEYRLVEMGRQFDADLTIFRRPLSGSSTLGKLDVVLRVGEREFLLEAKYRKDGDGFKRLYGLSSFQDEVVILDNVNWMVLSFSDFLRLVVHHTPPVRLKTVTLEGVRLVEQWLQKALAQGGQALVVGMWRREPLVILPSYQPGKDMFHFWMGCDGHV